MAAVNLLSPGGASYYGAQSIGRGVSPPPQQYQSSAGVGAYPNLNLAALTQFAPSTQQQQQQQQQQGMLPPGLAATQQEQQRAQAQAGMTEEARIHSLILDLHDPTLRESALLELSKKREQFDDLALVLWHSFGVMAVLLQEIVAVYPALSPPSLTAHVSNRVCNALALLQCVASHSETRQLFLNAHIPLFLYPFLNTTAKTRPFEYLRLTSLGVIGALVKVRPYPRVFKYVLRGAHLDVVRKLFFSKTTTTP